MSTASPPAPALAPRALRHRRSARRMTAGQLANFRRAITGSQAIGDDRGYQRWAGVHGLPLPISCVTDSVRGLLERGVDAAKATVVARSEGRASNDVLAFDQVRLATYA